MSAPAPAAEVKEVVMDVGGGMDGMAGGGGGGGKTRRRRAGGRRRRTRAAADDDSQIGGGGAGTDVSVEKAEAPVVAAAAPVAVAAQKGGAPKTPKAATVAKAPVAAAAAAVAPKVVIAPPKKKPAKLLFVPKHKVAPGHRIAAAKTFKARRVSVTIDNTAKTQKRRTQTIQRVEGMSEDQLRTAAVAAKLSRRETVAKVPVDLLRQMLKDYYMMRGMLV